jgi:hypothetical protein
MSAAGRGERFGFLEGAKQRLDKRAAGANLSDGGTRLLKGDSLVSIRSHTLRLALGAAIGAGAVAATPALASTEPTNARPCFPARDWQSWKSPSPNVIYVRVFLHDYYRLDLSAGSSTLSWPDVHLVSIFRGSDWVCSPLDLQLYVSDHGFREPLIVRSITKLTPEEVAQIPPKFRP